MALKTYRHFEDPGSLFRTLEEIKDRIRPGYQSLAETLSIRIGDYYAQIPETHEDAGKSVKAKLLVGLSGGIDSSLVVYLAVRAVGVENVIAITMPGRKDDKSIDFSALVRGDLGMADASVQYVIPIWEVVEKEIALINDLAWPGIGIATSPARQTDMDRMRIGNFASRTRIAILYDVARKVNGRILGTGNRTEFVQGYAAKYGTPISFDFGILDELYKTDIYELAAVLGLPAEVMNREPSTGYFPGQTHEKELGATWEEQDALAFLLFERRMTRQDLAKTYHVRESFIETMIRRYERSKEKRMLKQPHIHLGCIDDDNT